jgi:hypothetical protein
MKFAHPEILWALLALAIPILVHLFNFRKFKRVSFSNVAFLREVKQETKSKSKLKHLLILASRLLAILFIVLAFAQPYIPLNQQSVAGTSRNVSFYIDNSFSMDAVSGEGRLLDLAKEKATEVVSAYQATDKFQLLTNDFEGRHQRFHSQDDVLEMIQEIDVSPFTKNISEVVERQQDLLLSSTEGTLSAYVFSDLQSSTHRLNGFVPDSSISVRFLPDLASRSANIFIDSIWFETPVRLLNQPERLNVRIKHNASEALENVPMTLIINGQQKAIGSFNLVPGLSTDTALFFTSSAPGLKQCVVKIEDHPVVYDDDYFFGFNVASQISVLQVKGSAGNSAFKSIFGNDPYYSLTETSAQNIDYSGINAFDLVILDQLQNFSSGLIREINQFTTDGGTVMLFPNESTDVESYNELLLSLDAPLITGKRAASTKVSFIDLENYIYEGVFDRIPDNIDLPVVSQFLSFSQNTRSNENVLLALQDGNPFFFGVPSGSGQLYVSAVSLASAQSNFSQHAIFVPTVLRVAEFSHTADRMDYTIGGENVIELNRIPVEGDATFKLIQKEGNEFIPRYRNVRNKVEIFVASEGISAGNFTLALGDTAVLSVGLNYPREESQLTAWSKTTWEEQLALAGWNQSTVLETDLQTVSNVVDQLDQGRTLWTDFIWLALAMLVLELLLIKFWKP